MKLLAFVVLLLGYYVCKMQASVIPAVASTYAVAPGPAVVTAQSHQVVARNYNRVYVPSYWPAATYPTYTYPSYTYGYTTPAVVPYGTYPYGYYPTYTYRVGSVW